MRQGRGMGVRWTFRELIVSMLLLQGIAVPLTNRLVEMVGIPPVSTTSEGSRAIATQGGDDGAHLRPINDDPSSV